MIQTTTKHKFTVEDVMLMEKSGILGADESIELIDGELIDMSPILPPYANCMTLLTRLFYANLSQSEYIISSQNPVKMTNESILEPDLVVTKYADSLLKNQFITPHDIVLLVEVSDSTYKIDKGRKLEIYAESGVKEYWIVNIAEKQIEIHTAPEGKKYTSINLVAGELKTSLNFTFQVGSILPQV